MHNFISKSLEICNPFGLSVDSVLSIAAEYLFFSIIDTYWRDNGRYTVVGYKFLYGGFVSEYDLFSCCSFTDCLFIVNLFRNVRDIRSINKFVKEEEISG